MFLFLIHKAETYFYSLNFQKQKLQNKIGAHKKLECHLTVLPN